MSKADSRALIETYIRASNAADHEAMLACVSDEVIFDAPNGDRVIGKEKFRWRIGLSARQHREQLGDLVILVDEGGDRAAVEFTARGTVLPADDESPGEQSYSISGGMFFEIDDGLISRITSYRNLAGLRALSAAG